MWIICEIFVPRTMFLSSARPSNQNNSSINNAIATYMNVHIALSQKNLHANKLTQTSSAFCFNQLYTVLVTDLILCQWNKVAHFIFIHSSHYNTIHLKKSQHIKPASFGHVWQLGHWAQIPPPSPTKTQHTLQTMGGSRAGQRGLTPSFFSEIFHYF